MNVPTKKGEARLITLWHIENVSRWNSGNMLLKSD